MPSNVYLENYVPCVKEARGTLTKLPITTVGTSANLTIGGTITPSGSGGLAQASTVISTVFHSGGVAPTSATPGTAGTTNTTPVTTDTYVCEVYIPANTTITGVSVLNGSAVSGNINVGLAGSNGAVVAQSATTTAGSGTTAYQQIPFTAPFSAHGPGKHFILVQFSATTARFVTHTIGNFSATAVTSETYGTFQTTAAYATTTFTTAVGPVADTY